MAAIELECPACYGVVRIANTDSDQHEACEDCQRLYAVTFDPRDRPDGMGLRADWRLRECGPPDWRDVAGDEAFHRKR